MLGAREFLACLLARALTLYSQPLNFSGSHEGKNKELQFKDGEFFVDTYKCTALQQVLN